MNKAYLGAGPSVNTRCDQKVCKPRFWACGHLKRGYQQTQTLTKRKDGAPAAVRNNMQKTEFWPPPIRLDLACNPEQNASNSSRIAL